MKLSTPLLLLLLSLSIGTFGQNEKIDSLQIELNNQPNRLEKANILIELVNQWREYNIDTAEVYLAKAESLIPQIDDQKTVARFHHLKGNIYSDNGQYSDAVESYNYSLMIREEINDTMGIFDSHNNIARAYFFMDEYEKALNSFQFCYNWAKNYLDTVNYSIAVGNLGVVYNYMNDNENAIKYMLESATLDEALKDTVGLAKNYNNIGIAYESLNLFEQAEYYFEKSIELRQQAGDIRGIYSPLLNLGLVYKRQNNFEGALESYMKALDAAEKTAYDYGKSLAFANIGNVYNNIGQYEKGLEYHMKALEIDQNMDNPGAMARNYVNIGDSYRQMGRYSEAVDYMKRGIEGFEEKGKIEDIIQAYRTISVTYREMGDYEQSLAFVEKYNVLEDSLRSTEVQEKMLELQAKYEDEKKENEILRLQKEKAQSDLQITNQELMITNNRLIISGVASISILLMAFLGYWFHRNKRRLEGQLATERINYQQELLRATVLAQEEERKRIAKELHDGIGQQLTALKMRWQSICDELERIREQKNDDFNAITSLVDNTSQDVREISHRMMPRTLGEKGLVESVSDMLNTLMGKTDIEVEFEFFNADKRYPEEIEVSAYRVIQELVNNVVKHSRATQVSVQIMENREKLVIIVEDNGVGFDPEKQSGGIGLLNMRSRINALDGELNFDPSPSSGTIAMARIPVSLSQTA